MPFTNFPGGVSSLGMPVLPGGVPIMGSKAKVFFVDGARGSNGNRGTDWRKPVATVTKALTLCTDKAGDVIVLMNDGNTSGTSRDSATLTWSLDNTHLVGLCAPTVLSQRARISPPSTNTTIVTPQLNVTGNGNSFWNISLFEGDDQDATASIGVQITGARNYFKNVAMMNMGHANSADEANSAHLLIDGGEENTFDGCYIGLDTTARSAGNANVELKNAATRNTFRNCMFPAFADASTPVFVKIDSAGDIDRWVLFDSCIFMNATNSTASTMTVGMTVANSAGGHVIVKDSSIHGATAWVAAGNAFVRITGPVPTKATTGLSVDGGA